MLNTKPIICFAIEVFEREIDTRLFCAAYMAQRGWHSIVCHQSDPIIDRLRHAFILRSGGLGRKKDWHPSNFVCAHNEEGLITHGATHGDQIMQRRMHEKRYNSDRLLLTWGERHDAICRRARDVETVVAGSPKFDLMRNLKKGNNTSDLRVNINSRFPLLFGPDGDDVEKYIAQMRKSDVVKTPDEEAYTRRLFANDQKIAEEIRAFITLLSEEGSVKIVVRPHPAESIERVESYFCDGTIAEIELGKSLLESVANTDIVVHDGCTTGLEAKAAGRFVIALRPKIEGNSYNNFANKFSDNSFYSASEAVQKVMEICEHRELLSNLRDISGEIRPFIANWSDDLFCQRLELVAETWRTKTCRVRSKVGFLRVQDYKIWMKSKFRVSDMSKRFSPKDLMWRLSKLSEMTSRLIDVSNLDVVAASSRSVFLEKKTDN